MLAQQLLINRYTVDDPEADLLGSGAMGVVYRGWDTQTGQVVAIKALRPEVTETSQDLITRFLREGQALRELNHPNIVRVLDTIRDDKAAKGYPEYFIVMEYMEGGTLEQLLQENTKLSVDQTLDLALDLSDALTRTHRLGVIHRDLKPANVLLAKDKSPRLTDFGMAHMEKSSRLTQDGTLIGTIDYLSPEALNAKNLDARADIWSFGVLLWEMLCGYPPFRRENVGATLAAILSDEMPDIRVTCSEAPASLNQLLSLMLEKDRNKRVPSMRLVGAELEAILQGRDVRDRESWDQLIASYAQTPSAQELRTSDAVAVSGLNAQQMVSMMIAKSQERGESYISLPSLAFAFSIRDELELNNDSLALMIRSALFHDEPFEHWLDSVDSEESASAILKSYYDSYPPPEVRGRIVNALARMTDESATVVMQYIASRDDSPDLRAQAALVSASRGNQELLIRRTLTQVQETGDLTSLTTLAALVDAYELPEDTDLRLKLQLSFVLAKQRWARYRKEVRAQAFRTAKYGLLMALAGAATPLIMQRMDIESYQLNTEAMGVPAWVLSLIVFFALYGFGQGLAAGFFPALSDAIWIGSERKVGRVLISSPSGLVYTVIMFLFLGLQPELLFVQRVLYIPLTILLGLLVGALLSFVVPVLGSSRRAGGQLARMLFTSLLCIGLNAPYLYFLFNDPAAYLIFSRLLFVGLLPLVFGLPFIGRSINPVVEQQ